MTEMTPERRAAWQAEEDRKDAQRLKTDRDRKNKANRKASNKARMALRDTEDSECLKQQSWLRAYLGPANYNASLAARMVEYPVASSGAKGWELKKKFAKKIAAHFEENYLQKSAVVASLVNTWNGPGEYLAFDDGGLNVAQTIENLREAGLMGLIVGVKETKEGTELKFRDADQALGRIIQMTGLNAPVKISGTLTLDGLTPQQIQEKANEVLARVVERQQKLLNMPSDLDDDDIPEADIVQEDDFDDDTS